MKAVHPGLRWGALAVVVIAVGIVGIRIIGGGEISGSTDHDRVNSVHDVAARGTASAAKTLANAALHDASPQVREAALFDLSRCLRPEVRPAVEQATSDPSPLVRAAASTTLGDFADEASVERLSDVCAKDESSAVRVAAVAGLGRNNNTRSIVALREIIESSTDVEAQHRAMKELFRKLGIRYVGDEPTNPKKWRKYALYVSEFVKRFPEVQEAYAKAGRELPSHRERITDAVELAPEELGTTRVKGK